MREDSYILSTQISQRIVQRLFTCHALSIVVAKFGSFPSAAASSSVYPVPQVQNPPLPQSPISQCRGGNLCIVDRLCRSRCGWRPVSAGLDSGAFSASALLMVD